MGLKPKVRLKNLAFEEAYLHNRIFFPQKVVVLWSPTRKPTFLRKLFRPVAYCFRKKSIFCINR